MKEKIAKKWVAALRSGNYKQTDGTLRDATGFCCLGVLCNLHAETHPKTAAKQTSLYEYMGEQASLPEKVVKWAEMYDEDGHRRDGVKLKIIGMSERFSSLSSANDDGASFLEIADYIEENYKEL